jgi:hypothetical protein
MNSAMEVFWLLFSNEMTGSSRMHGFMVDEYLKKIGRSSSIFFSPQIMISDIPWDESDHALIADHLRGGIVFFQKLEGPNTEALIRRLKQDGTLTVYGMGDYLPQNRAPQLCDAVVCASEDLVEYYRGEGCANVVYIPDPAEIWTTPERARTARPIRQGLKVGWIGSRGNFEFLDPIAEMLKEEEFRDLELISISDHPNATMPWSMETVRRMLPEFDIALVPTGTEFKAQVKSINRPLLFMANGIPVVASPLKTYHEIIRHGWNGYFAEDLDGFRAAIRELRDPETRKTISWNAYSSVVDEYSLEKYGERWKAFFESLEQAREAGNPAEPSRTRRATGRSLGYLKALADLRVAQLAIRRGHLGIPRRLIAKNLATVFQHPRLFQEVAEVVRGRPKGFFLRWF